MRTKISNHSKFTLVELIVAMAIFSILAMLMLQFFSGAQKLWANAEKQNSVYGNARIAMNIMSMMLQNTLYNAGESGSGVIPFRIAINEDPADLASDKIYFYTNSPLDLTDSSTDDVAQCYFVSFQRQPLSSAPDSKLLIVNYNTTTASDLFNGFYNNPMIWNSLPGAFTTLVNNYPSSPPNPNVNEIAQYVTRVKFIPGTMLNGDLVWYNKDANGALWNLTTGAPGEGGYRCYDNIPYALNIVMSVLSQNDYDRWKELRGTAGAENTAAQEFRKQHEKTFSRTIFLGDRNYVPGV